MAIRDRQLQASADMGTRIGIGQDSTWHLTWPALPLLFVFVLAILDIPFLPAWQAAIDKETGSLQAFATLGQRIELGVSQEMGKWWIGEGTEESQLERWMLLIDKIDWSIRRAIAILAMIGLALIGRWSWSFRVPGVRVLPPVLVIACCIGLAIAIVSGAHSMHYLLYGDYVYLGQVTDEHRTLLYGEFSTWVKFYGSLILAPIAEEIVFRGWLQRVLTPLCKVWPAVLLQAIAFGASHINHQGFNGFLITGSFGLLLGLVFVFSGKLWPCILCHSLMNLYGSADDIWWIWNGRPE